MIRSWPFLPRIFVLGLLAAAPLGAQQGPVDGAAASPFLRQLAADLGRGNSGAAAAFWEHVETTGTPLVEPDTVPGHAIVTLVARGGPDVAAVGLDSYLNVLLVAPGTAPHPDSIGALRRMQGSDIWYASFRLRRDIRVPYRFEVRPLTGEPSSVPDPYNPEVWEPDVRGLAASILELEGAPPQPWRNPSGTEGAGDWDALTSEEDGRGVYIYKPPSWAPDPAEPYPVLIGLGAFGHGIGMRVDRMLDTLIATGRLPPMVVALVDLTRTDEATGYASVGAFLLDELIPHLRQSYGVTGDPSRTVLSGTSRRGMVAALLAHRHPERFGNVLSLSGSYYWSPDVDTEPESVPRLYAEGERRPIRFYVAAGELETWISPTNGGLYLLATNRHMRDVLRARGYDTRYVVFNGGHSELSWQDGLADGLGHFLGARQVTPP